MAFNIGDAVVARDGVAGQVVSKFFGTVPSESSRTLGYWEASNSNQIPQWYQSPSLSLDSERNSGKDTSTYTPPGGADWSQAREFASGGTPHDSVPYTVYGVKKLQGTQGRGVMEEISEETITGFQVGRVAALTVDPVSKALIVLEAGKLNHPHIP